jgi:phage pi2 protein 07
LATELEAAFLGQFVPMHPRFTARTDAENPGKIYFPNLSLWLLELAWREMGLSL